MPQTKTAQRRLPLHWKIAIGFVAGLALGLIVYYGAGTQAPWVQMLTRYVTQPFSTLFLSLIFMLIVPLLFSALVVGVSEMGDIRSLGRIGWRTLAYTILLSGIAVLLGLVMVNVFKPGAGVDPLVAQQLLNESAERAQAIVRDSTQQPKGMDMLLAIVPQNVIGAASSNASILALMFFALMFGIGIVMSRETPAIATLKRGIEGLFEVSMTLIGLVIRLAPYAALLADHAAVLQPLVLAAQALVVLDRPEDLRAEQAVALRLERAVVDRLGLLDLAVRPAADLLRRREPDADRVEFLFLRYLLEEIE